MKRNTKFLIIFFLLSGMYSHAQTIAKAKTKTAKTTTTSNAERLDMTGAYLMTRQHATDGAMDTSFNRRQFKMYTDRHMIYVHAADNDSLAVYGIGTYRLENGKVIENIFYHSDTGSTSENFTLSINKSSDGYSQVIYFPNQTNNKTFVLTEDYKRVDRNVKSPLDGAWKQVRLQSTAPDGTITTLDNPTQFKLYQAGNFVWVHTTRDSATQKPLSYYGYGTFTMKGKNTIIETNTNTTFASSLTGVPVTVQIKLLGNDSFEQTLVTPDGFKMVELYQRMQ